MNIVILAIGNEVLCGKVVNTNSAFIAREISQMGAKIIHQEVVSDQEEDIIRGLKHAYSYADFVITIGGLGPTIDDLTRYGVAKYFDEELVYDEELFQEIASFFSRFGRQAPENNKRQAERFKTGTVIPNRNGTAPGLYLKKNNQTIFLLPGPPNELEPMLYGHVLPYFKERLDKPLISRSYRLYGIGESDAESRVIDVYQKFPMLNIAPYCEVSYIDYLVSTTEDSEEQLDAFEKEFLNILGAHHIGDQSTALNKEVIRLLKEKGLTIATAESCTGGMLASELVNVEGASSVFLEGVVAYSNEAKQRRLNVEEAALIKHGAVSECVAKQMSQHLKSQTGADVGVAITGIAGPNGGTDLKPVGLTYIAITIGDKTQGWSHVFHGNREKIRERATSRALYLLYYQLSKVDREL